jgi:hypothetical protein
MNLDGQITERIINAFTDRDVPILTIHDSYIVPVDEEEALEDAMREAFEEVMGITGVRLKEETERPGAIVGRYMDNPQFNPMNPGLRNTLLAEEFNMRADPDRTERYQNQRVRFEEWLREQQDPQETS